MSALRELMMIEVYNSVSGAAFFQRLLQEWRDTGARVTTYEAISESDYRARRGAIGRLALRWRMYAGYAWVCWRGARKQRNDSTLRVVTTNPFFAPALVRWTSRGRGQTIHLLYDLFPEALVQAGTIEPDSWMAIRCAAITRYSLRECAATVFLGERLRTYTEAVYGTAQRAVVIPVGADGAPFRNFPPQALSPGTMPRILYSGLMGSMHDSATLVTASSGESFTGVSWAFHASGVGYTRLCQAVGVRPNVRWGSALPDAAWQDAMKQAQVALVTIAPGAERVVMPSKTYSALVAGQAILAICHRASDLADLVIQHDCGWVVEPGDAVGLSQVIASIAHDPVGLWAKRKNAFAAGHQHYDMAPIAAQWTTLFAELNASNQPATALCSA